MTFTIRTATLSDLDQLVTLMLADAKDRHAADPDLWRLDRAASDKTRSAIAAAMKADDPSFRQQWLVADVAGRLIGVTHSILLPVPPIYAGEFGPPGLIMEDCFVTPGAPPDTKRSLLSAAETDLKEAGARILLASSIVGGDWENALSERGYEPLTMYFAKSGLMAEASFRTVRHADVDDIPAIVASSAVNRSILNDLHHLFWKPHKDADDRFGSWMQRSLTLDDRDMFVADDQGGIEGYAISQPATPLHFPTPHDISGVGVIDDFYHDALEDAGKLAPTAPQAAALFAAAEAARGRRADHSVLVVCPAAWQSRVAFLEQQGYRNAITWHIRMVK